MATKKVYPTAVAVTSSVNFDSSKNRYKRWDNLDNLKQEKGIALCRDPNATSTPTIAGRNGTYYQPAPIDLTFKIDTTDVYNIEKIILHYRHGKYINNGYYPDIGGATITVLGSAVSTKTGKAVPAINAGDDGVAYSLTFTGVTIAETQKSNFGIRIAYPKNTSTTPGRILLQDVYLEVIYNKNVTVALKANTTKNPIVMGDITYLNVSATKTGNYSYDSNIEIELPAGLSYLGVETENTTLKISSNRLIWTPNFAETNNILKTIKIKLKGTSSGKKRINVTETKLEVKTSTTLVINPITYEITSNIYNKHKGIPEDNTKQFTVSVNTNNTGTNDNTLVVTIPAAININTSLLANNEYITSYKLNGTQLTVNYKNPSGKTFTITLKCKWDSPGLYEMLATVNNGFKTSIPFFIIPKLWGDLCYSYYRIPEYYLEDMGYGIDYTVATYGTAILNEDGYDVTDTGTNLRIGVFNGTEEEFSDETEFLDNVRWSEQVATQTGIEQTTSFKYIPENPVIIVYSYDHVDNPILNVLQYNFTDPLIVETALLDTEAGTGVRQIIPHPASALKQESTYAICDVPENVETVPISCDDWEDGGLLSTDIAIHGITVLLDYITSESIEIEAEVYLNGKSGSRSLILDKGKGTLTLGSVYDLFEFNMANLIQDLNSMEVRITEKNVYTTTSKVQINNLRLKLSYINISKCKYGFSINNLRSEWFGMYLIDADFNFGAKHDSNEYHVSGTDETIINRLNVNPKEITLTIKVPNCNIKESIPQIDKIVELFTNEREVHTNKPIPKQIIFDKFDDRQFNYVLIDNFNDEFEGGTYKAEIKLYIPEGTSYNVESVLTGASGTASGVIAVKPIITVRADTDGELTLTETFLNQYMLIKSTNIHKNDEIVIDNINRSIYSIPTNADKIDLLSGMDYNSSWFKIKGEYSFESANGTILSVEYYPRR